MEESLRRHADEQAAVELRAYLVVPYLPAAPTAHAALAGLRRNRLAGAVADARAGRRTGGRRARARRTPTRCAPSSRRSGCRSASSTASRCCGCCGRASTRPPPTGPGGRPSARSRCSASSTRRATASRRGGPRWRCASGSPRSSLDFTRARHVVEVERDLEQVIYAARTAQQTTMGWLMGAMMTRQPYTLSVFVHALDRRRERQKIKLGYRRLFAINRGAEQRGRVPDFDRYAQESEYQRAAGPRWPATTAPTSSRSPSTRRSAPAARAPDLAALGEAVDYCVEQLESASDCKVNRGEFRQAELWASTLPLGRDVARRTRKYATRNVGDTVPLVGTACGSPTGIPFAFSDPGRTVERLNPYDPEHANHTLLICGKGGSGKTMTANVILARAIAHGARAFVLDRAGHYELLSRLVDGAQQIVLGADDSPYAVNPWDVPDPREVSREKIAFLISLHALLMGDEGLGKAEIAQLGEAIRAVYAKAATLEGATPRESLLREELVAMAEHNQRHGAVDVAALLRNLAMRLNEYCGEGTYAYLLDRETTVPADSPLVVFDTRRCPTDVLRPGDVRADGVRHPHRRARTGRRSGPLDGSRRAAVRGALDHADRRGLAHRRARADRRVRQRPRPPRPPPRARADRDEPAALGLRHRARAGAAAELDDADAARPAPQRAALHPLRARSSQTRRHGWSGG